MSGKAVIAIIDAISEAEVSLPGINGEASTAAYFAGQWTERYGLAAASFQSQHIYEAFTYFISTGIAS